MIYPFKCDSCGKQFDAVRPASESSLPQTCVCGQQMRRIYTATLFAIDRREYFDYGLGCHVRNRADQLDAIKRLRDGKVNGRSVVKTDEKGHKYFEKVDIPGIDVVEIGNEKLKTEKRHEDYTIPRGVI